MATPTSITPFTSATFSGVQAIDSLLYGTMWASSTITYSFPGYESYWSTASPSGYGPTYGGEEPWSVSFSPVVSSDQEAIREAFANWSAVANLTFVETGDADYVVGDMRFAYTYIDGMDGSQAHTYAPSNGTWAGDVWFNATGTSYTNPWVEGSYEYQTVIHEIGHALGLKHPFAASSYSGMLLDPSLDSRSFTTMSYAAAPGDESTYFSYEPTTPMALDIAAIQHLYGANTSTGAGNTTYTFTDTGYYHKTIWDAAGIDTIAYNSPIGGEIDLTSGVTGGSMLGAPVYAMSGTGQVLYRTYNIFIAYETVIENATGGTGDDLIIGNEAANVLNGGAGSDTLRGGAGNDTYIVDSISDVIGEVTTISTEIDTVQSSVDWTLGSNLERLTLTGTNVVAAVGNSLANTLTGNGASNRLDGGAGNDVLNGGAGNDSLFGSTGNDTYVVDSASDLISESSTTTTETDTVQSTVSWTLGANLERLTLSGSLAISGVGNTLANTITGNAAANSLNGSSGNDTINGGAGNDILTGGLGNDSLIGGTGNDTYVVDSITDIISETSTTTTEVDTVQTTVSWTLGANLERLMLTGVSAIAGTGNTLGNMLTGNSAANSLDGSSGNDTINGGAGNDILTGSTGNDSLVGGTGNDAYVVESVYDIISELITVSTEIDSVQSSVSWTLGANLERLTLTGTSAVTGVGNTLANTLIGNGAANSLNGSSGNDTVSGGLGNDTLIGGAGNDSLVGGSGNDFFRFTSTLSSSSNVDKLSDFNSVYDALQLDDAVFKGIGAVGALNAAAFRIGGSAGDTSDRVVYNSSTGSLYFDADGSGSGAAVLFATVAANTSITSADLFVV